MCVRGVIWILSALCCNYKCLCMYVRMHASVCISMHQYASVCISMHQYACMDVWMDGLMYAYMYARVFKILGVRYVSI